MKLNRFQNLLKFLRFDNKIERRRSRMSAFEEIFELFRKNLSKGIIPSENLSLDEQLVNFHGRCSFKTYMPKKPGKYGIKIWTLCDVSNSYCLNQKVYLGKDDKDSPPDKNLSLKVAMELVNSYDRPLKGRNITTDSFFTSFELYKIIVKKGIDYTWNDQ